MRMAIGTVARGVESAANGKGEPSPWEVIPMGPPDPILGLTEAFKEDTDKRKARGDNYDNGWMPYPPVYLSTWTLMRVVVLRFSGLG